ncbi:hypothetical protein AB6A40_002066 [Gnathostoma spinigerum]|uniref:Uncharacterized protein n=1 Tax=Gnathostoma spinigerum TaxID=75299 RepID=A0ABD6E7U5_9BILA
MVVAVMHLYLSNELDEFSEKLLAL